MEEQFVKRVDAAISLTGLLVRLAGYAVIATLAANNELGRVFLAGVLLGDMVASLLNTLVLHRERLPQMVAELALIGLVYLWVRHDLAWPEDPAMRAIMALSAFGVFAGRAGGSMMSRLGRTEHPFG